MNISKNEKKEKILRLFDEHPGAFADIEKERLLNYISYDDEELFIPDLAREVYDELGFVEDDKNIYLGFMDLLKNAFPYQERKILEVGGGILPRLGKRISDQLTTGHITIYDPRLSRAVEDTPKMTLVRRKLTRSDSIGDTNLMVGFMPCEGTETFLNVATQNNIDFMLGFCEGGPHGDCYDFYEDEDEWLHAMMYVAESGVRDHHMGKVKVKTLEKYGDPYPVIYNER